MKVINARNVAEALPLGVQYLLDRGVREQSRAGEVIVSPVPVTTVYTHPRERVLTSPVRDANPFFHLAEIAWMLAGRDDAALLNNFVADFGLRFAESASGKENWEEGGRIHGAYGKRWRSELGYDQLAYVIEKLRRDPESRQCVIQMWDARPAHKRYVWLDGRQVAMTSGCDDLRGDWKDRPCNTHVYLRVTGQRGMRDFGSGDVRDYDDRELEMTVCCRSNDVIWGAYGANAVHFSALQEYLATCVGVGVGIMYQVSNNFHMYVSEMERLMGRCGRFGYHDLVSGLAGLPRGSDAMLIVENPDLFLVELLTVLGSFEDGRDALPEMNYRNGWMPHVLWPALSGHRLFKSGSRESALDRVKTIRCPDWQLACCEWMERRRKK